MMQGVALALFLFPVPTLSRTLLARKELLSDTANGQGQAGLVQCLGLMPILGQSGQVPSRLTAGDAGTQVKTNS